MIYMFNPNPIDNAITLSTFGNTPASQYVARIIVKSTPFDNTPKILLVSNSDAEDLHNPLHYCSSSESSFEDNTEYPYVMEEDLEAEERANILDLMQGIVRKVALISRENSNRTPTSIRDSSPTPIQIETINISSLKIAELKKYTCQKGRTIFNRRKPELVDELVLRIGSNTFEALIENLMKTQL